VPRHATAGDVPIQTRARARRGLCQLVARPTPTSAHAHAEAYENRLAETARTQPELIAHHFTEAGLIEAAIDYLQRAGGLAMARSAHVEAIRHFSTALDLLAKLRDAPNRAARDWSCVSSSAPLL